MKMNSWRNSGSPLADSAMPNAWLKVIVLYGVDEVKTGFLLLITKRRNKK